MKLERGAVVRVVLDPTVGHEQRGVRPAVLVSDPVVIGDRKTRRSAPIAVMMGGPLDASELAMPE